MALSLPTPKPCKDCGDGAIFHRITYVSIVLDDLMKPLTRPSMFLRGFASIVYAIERRVTPHLLEGMMNLGWATRVTEPDDDTQLLALMLWNEAKDRGMSVSEFRLFNLPRNIFVAAYPDGRKIAY
ncbi:MAG TPA: hypothetical protein VGE48_01300, partial [Candidatus Paceibacterota bacterium]